MRSTSVAGQATGLHTPASVQDSQSKSFTYYSTVLAMQHTRMYLHVFDLHHRCSIWRACWMSHASREARTRSVPARPGLAGRGLRLACILAGVFHAIALRSRRTMDLTPDGPLGERDKDMNTLPTETVGTTHHGSTGSDQAGNPMGTQQKDSKRPRRHSVLSLRSGMWRPGSQNLEPRPAT